MFSSKRFDWNFRKYPVKFISAISECVWDFQNNASWDTHQLFPQQTVLVVIIAIKMF